MANPSFLAVFDPTHGARAGCPSPKVSCLLSPSVPILDATENARGWRTCSAGLTACHRPLRGATLLTRCCYGSAQRRQPSTDPRGESVPSIPGPRCLLHSSSCTLFGRSGCSNQAVHPYFSAPGNSKADFCREGLYLWRVAGPGEATRRLDSKPILRQSEAHAGPSIPRWPSGSNGRILMGAQSLNYVLAALAHGPGSQCPLLGKRVSFANVGRRVPSLRPPATLWIQGTRRRSTCAAAMD
jgi:hypothetical protein